MSVHFGSILSVHMDFNHCCLGWHCVTVSDLVSGPWRFQITHLVRPLQSYLKMDTFCILALLTLVWSAASNPPFCDLNKPCYIATRITNLVAKAPETTWVNRDSQDLSLHVDTKVAAHFFSGVSLSTHTESFLPIVPTAMTNTSPHLFQWTTEHLWHKSISPIDTDHVATLEAIFLSTGCDVSGGYKFFKGSCYKYHSIDASWDSAQATCSVDDGHLVSISDGDEQAFVQGLLMYEHFYFNI